MVPLHSLLTMTPASSPADEKPCVDEEEGQQQLQQHQAINQQQHPTPPQDFAQPNNGQHFNNNPFGQTQQQIGQTYQQQQQVQNIQAGQFELQNGFLNQPAQNAQRALQQNGQQTIQQNGNAQTLQHHQASYAFPNNYQNGQPGSFSYSARNDSTGSNTESAPGTPGNGRVPIPRQGSAPTNSNATNANGPMSSSVTVPPRPKPGRKPMEDSDPHDRRRQQNRNAQRNFRDRRQQRLSDVTGELTRARQEYQDLEAERTRETTGLRRTINDLEASNRELRRQNDELQRQLAMLRVHNPANGPMRRDTTLNGLGLPLSQQTQRPRGSQDVTPPSSAHARNSSAMEIDFTTPRGRPYGAFRPQTEPPRGEGNEPRDNPASNADVSPGVIMGGEATDFNCGFCTRPDNCMCREQAMGRPEAANVLLSLQQSGSSPTQESDERRRSSEESHQSEQSRSQSPGDTS